jgi:hypothetical protein
MDIESIVRQSQTNNNDSNDIFVFTSSSTFSNQIEPTDRLEFASLSRVQK